LSSLAAGSTLSDGRYRLDAVLGRGGMAIVWRASDLQLERTVAIKVISDVLATDPRFVERFRREARLAAGLNHPNLVKVFDFSGETERPFLTMEYVPGGSLADARDRPLDAEPLARELLDAVAHIHTAGILHRDIKPANVLLGSDGSPRLTDFGIARSDETSALTQTGQVLGTLRYIAPEVAAGEPATIQSDLYSLGILLRETAGESPPGELARLLERLTARDPADRPGSAAAALTELDPTRMLRESGPTGPKEPPESTAPTAPIEPTARTAPTASTASTTPIRTGALSAQAEVEGSEHPYTVSSNRLRGPIKRSHAIAAAAVLLAVLAIVIVAATSGGGSKLDVKTTTTTLRPAPAGAPVDQQLDRLEQLVRAAPQQR
jgi:eukaryotic-like serine/threonine-protein kinase